MDPTIANVAPTHPLLEESDSSHPLLATSISRNTDFSESTKIVSASADPSVGPAAFSSLRQAQASNTRPNISYFDLKGLTQRLEKAQLHAQEEAEQKEELRQREIQNEKRRRRWTQFQTGQPDLDSNSFDSDASFDQELGDNTVGKSKGLKHGKGKRVEDDDQSQEDERPLHQGASTPRSTRSPGPLSPKHRQISEGHTASSENSSSVAETPKKRFASSASVFNPRTPQGIDKCGTPSSFEKDGPVLGEGIRSSSGNQQPLWENEDDEDFQSEGEAERDEPRSQSLRKPSLSLLSSLHLMSDRDIIDLGTSLLKLDKQQSRQAGSLSVAGSQLSPLIILLRLTSSALSNSLVKSLNLQDDLASSEVEHSLSLKSLKSKSVAREDVLRALCKERGGITDGEIQRALTRASAPVIEVAPLTVRSKNPPNLASATPIRPKGKKREVDEANLLSSLQEAMLDDVSGNDQMDRLGGSPARTSGSRSRSRSVTPSNAGSVTKRSASPGSSTISTTRSQASSSESNLPRSTETTTDLSTSKVTQSIGRSFSRPRAENASSKALPAEFHSSSGQKERSKSVSSSATASSSFTDKAAGGISGWASGFMPWGPSPVTNSINESLNTGPSSGKARAITQSTSPAEVEADGYLSPFGDDARAITTASKSESDLCSDEAQENCKPARIVSNPAKSNASGLGLLGSLAWRRKKTGPSMIKGVRQVRESPDLRPTPPVLSPTAVEKEPSLSSYFSHESGKQKAISGASSQLSKHTSTTSPSTRSNMCAESASLNSSRPGSQATSPGVEVSDPTAAIKSTTESKVQLDRKSLGSPISRPTASHTASGRDVLTALYEAIGSPPSSPSTERLQVQSEPDMNSRQDPTLASLPKPPHFKAIILATRIMTSDPSSIVYDNGKRTSKSTARLAFSLVGRAREEGKITDSLPIRITEEITFPKITSFISAVAPSNADTARDHEPASAEVPTSNPVLTPPRFSTSSALPATLGRAFGRYKDTGSSSTSVHPNVTRLPHLYSHSSPHFSALEKISTSVRNPQNEQREIAAPISVELESMNPHDIKPPTFALFSRQRNKKAEKMSKGESKTGIRLGRLTEEEESSGDEFEVYGGKGLVPPPAYSSVRPVSSRQEDASQLMTDRYGFVYDPADVKLLRQARKESATAPACLTGIRIGVSARGADEDEEEEEEEANGSSKEDFDSQGPRHDDESESDEFGSNRSSARENASVKTADSSIGVANQPQSDSASVSSRTSVSRTGLLPIAPSTAVVEASALSVASQSSLSSGPTSPSQEIEFTLSSTGGEVDSTHGDVFSNRSDLSPSFSDPQRIKRTRSKPKSSTSAPGASTMTATPSLLTTSQPSRETPEKLNLSTASQTVKSLLGQLQTMHDKQQADQQALWDDFLRRRKEKEAALVSTEGKSVSIASTLRKGALKDPRNNMLNPEHTAGSAQAHREPEENWSSGLVGIARMGDHSTKSSKADWKEFLSLCQSGIPLIYRSKIWQECSGANEAMEPGRYMDILKEHEGESNSCTDQIDLDVNRTMPTNVYFGGDGPGVPKLRRLLVAFSWWNPECGYCQGMNNLAATLLLTHASEEDAFWVLVCMIEVSGESAKEYYTANLLVSQADQRVLIDLVNRLMPTLSAHMEELGVDLPAVTFAWFLSLYTDCLPVETLFRVWDVLFVEGMSILFRVAIAILQINEKSLLATKSPAAFYGLFHSMTSRLFSVDRLMSMACGDLKERIRYNDILLLRASRVKEIESELGLSLTDEVEAVDLAVSRSSETEIEEPERGGKSHQL